jgi:20S proteasome alpha/beta subunit
VEVDGIPDIMVKFDRSEVQKILTTGDKVKVTVTGTVSDIMFEGDDYVQVIK